jgi:MYXO-CTERM domain-containing protein
MGKRAIACMLCTSVLATAPVLCTLVVEHVPLAHACTCSPQRSESAPPDGGTIPRNAPALAVANTAGPPSEAGIALRDGSDASVGFDSKIDPLFEKARLIVPSTSLTPGPYALSFMLDTAGAMAISNFVVSDSAPPLPTSLGPVKIFSRDESAIVPTLEGTCSQAAPGFTLTLRAEIAKRGWDPWLPLAHFTTYLDGVEYHESFSICGESWGALYGAVPQTRIVKICPSPPAHLIVRMHGHVAGATSDPPDETLELDLICPGGDAGTDSGIDADAGLDAGNGNSPSGGCGCGVGRASKGHGAVLLTLLLALASRGRRRSLSR